jgi:hypothetical protein
VVGKPIKNLMPQRYREVHEKGLERAKITDKHGVIGNTVELEGLKKGGIEFPIELSLSKWETKGSNIYPRRIAIVELVFVKTVFQQSLNLSASTDRWFFGNKLQFGCITLQR